MTSANFSILIFMTSLTLAVPARAESSQADPKKSPAGRTPSSVNRENLNWSVLGDMSGTWSPITAPGVGLIVGYHLWPNEYLEANYIRSAAMEWYGGDQIRFLMNSFAVRFKHFTGNSFFVEAGIATKQTQTKNSGFLDISGPTGSGHPDLLEQEITSYGPVFALGNRWQWSHFTICGTWFELYAPTSVSTKTIEEDGRLSPEKRELVESRTRKRTASSDLTVRFSLGSAF